ncbi:MAG: glycine--tRNA ligase subunit beta [Candidatus Omnitrophota bacterium]|jgi:glycyl-tRNA synthetase beta chain
MKPPKEGKNFLLEIGVEELPQACLEALEGHFAGRVREALSKNRLTFGEIHSAATPRRVALWVENLSLRQTDEVLEVTGPSCEKAYGADGRPTPALEGFLRSKKAGIEEIVVKQTPKGNFVCIRQKLSGRPAAAVVPSILTEVLAGIPFPKWMRWESSGFRFPRPVRWILALLGDKVMPFSLGDVRSGAFSCGHRFLSPKAFKVRLADWDAYRTALRKAHVLLEPAEREAKIREALEGRFDQAAFDEELVATTARLVEEPFLLAGSFSKTYLDLPAEVLASCMKKNQKIFALSDREGRMTHRFLAVLNGKRHGLDLIRSGYENVLESRLKDARYFYESDTREGLESKVPLLDQLVYLGKLGSMRQKSERLEKLAGFFCGLIGRHDLLESLARTARLSKADLMTRLVYEFPDLQGIVGREYALEAGESEEVARAIGSQYLPKNLAEDYRELSRQLRPLGAMFGVIDRLDLLAGAFGTGIEPTGSQDPYALRRAGGSLVKILRAFGFHFSLSEFVTRNAEEYGGVLQLSKEDLIKRLKEFLKDRVIFETGVKSGTRPFEILQAVCDSSFEDLADVYDRFGQLEALSKSRPDAFLKAAKVVERTANILKGFRQFEFREIRKDLLQSESERELMDLVEGRGREVTTLLTERDYEKTTVLFGSLFYDPLNRFFEKVLVNAEDSAVRCNRHLLMLAVNRLYTESLADLSRLSKLDQE